MYLEVRRTMSSPHSRTQGLVKNSIPVKCRPLLPVLVLRFVNSATHSFPETEHFHRGLRPLFHAYADGVNAYLLLRGHDLPLQFRTTI